MIIIIIIIFGHICYPIFFSIFWTSESLTETIIMISRKDIPSHHIQKAQFRNYSWKALVTQKTMQRHPLSRNILYLSALPQMHICSKPIITRKVYLENMHTHLKITDAHTHVYIHIHTYTDKYTKTLSFYDPAVLTN